MPVDPSAQAVSLVATPQEISPVEQQNRYGMRHGTISDLAPGKFLTVLAIQTSGPFSTEQFFQILQWLVDQYDVETMQTAFAATVPDFGEHYRNDLHLSAHLRAEKKETVSAE